MAISLFPQMNTGGSYTPRSRSKSGTSDQERTRLFTAKAWADSEEVPVSAPNPVAAGMVEGAGAEVPEETPKDTPEARQARYVENLHKFGLEEFASSQEKHALEMQESQIVLQNKRSKMVIDHINMGLGLASAGDTDTAMSVMNEIHPDGEKVTRIDRIDQDNFMVYSEDEPEGEKVNRLELSRSLADASKQMEGFFDPTTQVVNGKRIMTQKNMMSGEVKVLATIDAPDAGKLQPMVDNLWNWYSQLPATKHYTSIKEARLRAHSVAALENAPGDLALMKTYARATEPEGRTITDSDFTQVERAREISARLGISPETYKSLLNGGTLGATDRTRLLDSIETMYQTALSDQKVSTDRAFYARAEAQGVPKTFVTPVEQFYNAPADFKKYVPKKEADRKGNYPTKGEPTVVGTRKTKDGKTIEKLSDGTFRTK